MCISFASNKKEIPHQGKAFGMETLYWHKLNSLGRSDVSFWNYCQGRRGDEAGHPKPSWILRWNSGCSTLLDRGTALQLRGTESQQRSRSKYFGKKILVSSISRFSVTACIGWSLPGNHEGSFSKEEDSIPGSMGYFLSLYHWYYHWSHII